MKCKVCGKRFKLQADKRYEALKKARWICRGVIRKRDSVLRVL